MKRAVVFSFDTIANRTSLERERVCVYVSTDETSITNYIARHFAV